jgi:putative transposase
MPADLVSEALRHALAVRPPAPGLVIHSDQGRQYATNFKALVARHETVQSRSARQLLDNAHAEALRSRLKTDLRDGGSFRKLPEARLQIKHYLPNYNNERRPSTSSLPSRRSPFSNSVPTLCGLPRTPQLFFYETACA